MKQPLDPEMFSACSAENPPIRIGDKWTAKIIVCLRSGPRRFSELQVPLRGITPIRIGDKWTSKIIVCLEPGPRRFSELQVPLRGVTPKVLTATLRAMERDGLVTRTAYPEIPPRVEYELSPLGRTLLEPMAAMCAWSRAHLHELLDARESAL